MKRVLSVSYLILPLVALSYAHNLSAQTIVVDKTSLTFSSEVGGPAVTQTINVTSSTGSAVPFTLSFPTMPWLKVSGQLYGYAGTTPAILTVSADPTGLSAGTLTGSIAVAGGSSSTNPSIAVTFNISAIAVSPSSLSAGYTVGSSVFPLMQALNLTGNAQCTATAATTSGGNWFSLLQSSCVSPGTLAVVFNQGVIAGLAPNTYSGAVTITPVPAGQGPAIVVPVTLVVSPTPPVTVNPLSLLFNWQTGTAAANPSQTFTISTTAAQPLLYSLTKSVETGNWISTVDPPSGSIPANGAVVITVTLNPTGLATGTYKGKVTVLTPGGSPASQDLPVQLVVSNTPLLNVPNATLNFAYQLGTNAPAAQNVNITATSGTLSYAVNQSANSSWLVVPNAGSTSAPLSVSVSPAGLAPGTYTATIYITSATPGSTAQPIPVVLKVTNEPTLAASVPELKFPFQIGQSAPAAQSVKITSNTGVVLNYSASLATTNCGSAWLLLNGATATVTGTTPDSLAVSIATTGLAAGTCNGTLSISATNPATGAAAVNSPLAIPVTLTVSTTAQLVLSPTSLQTFTAGVGALSPAPQSVTLSSTNSDVLNYTVAFHSNNGNWLFVGPQGGSTAANNLLTISVISTGLAAGSYTGDVTITATGPGGAAVANSPVTIPVNLSVTAASLTLSSSSLSFEQATGGPVPASQTVTVGSSGQALNYTAIVNTATSVKWLSVTPASGNTSTSGVLTVSVDASGLTPGATYPGTIVVTSPGAGNSPATINVSFKVNAGTLSAPTTTLTFMQVAGGAAPPAQSIAVTGSPAALSFTVVAATQSGGNWLTATPASGTTPGTVSASVNGGSLPAGQYQGSITIASTGASGSPIKVPVVLNVVSSVTLTASPTSLAFASSIGQSAVPPLSLVVHATGSGATNVPVSAQVQYDGAAGQSWLTVTPATDFAPATFSVSVLPGALAAATYSGKIVLTSSNALAPVNVPVTLTVTAAVPQPVVNAVANAASYSTGAVSPGENIVIFGTGIGPAALVTATPDGNVFPTNLSNVRVLFDNTPSPVLYTSTAQTSVMVPYGVAGRATTKIVVEYLGVQSAPLTYNVAAAAPGIYTMNQAGTGPGAILNQNLSLNSAANPETRGNVIAIYMTGEGQTIPGGVDGAVIPPVASALKHPILPVTVTIGGVDAVVAYYGSAPSLISGVMQVNAVIPANAPSGAQPVVVTVGLVKSQSGASAATVAIQ